MSHTYTHPLTTDTGPQPIITPQQIRLPAEVQTSLDRMGTSRWACAAAAAVAATAYAFVEALASVPPLVTTALLTTAAVLALIAADGHYQTMSSRIRAAHLAIAMCRVRGQIGESTQQVEASIREELAARMGECAGSLKAELGVIRQSIDSRVEALEHRVDQQGQEYDRGWVDGAARATEAVGAGHNGKVRDIGVPRRPVN